ncbi:DUF6485 family protein [Clostridium aminobutyricum]|uniref:Uncharacterized protein n=1 Tax=Clostridium aminobutyricum TaxID=33953 RepID=A0A939II04_CLOAM|nr:DUF6485 family protein [Clostridium aminobutyricum]MBN7774417.1 hypothetical protein [Clostridium aminobutyricum]
MSNTDFCTCKNYSCTFHPRNHDKGCDLCIRICLHDGALPSCFFRDVSKELRDVTAIDDSSYEAFAKLVLKKKEDESH